MRTSKAAFLLLCILSSVSAQSVNVSVPGLEDEHKHKWWVWLIVSISGFSFLVSIFYVVRGIMVWRKRVREGVAARNDRAAYGSGDVENGMRPQADDAKTGIFSFWDTESAPLKPTPAAVDSPYYSDWRKAAQISATDDAKLRQHGMGPAALRRKECMYRMGEHSRPSHVLSRLQRHNSV